MWDPSIDAALSKRSVICDPQLEVLAPVTGSGVDEACSGLVRDVVAGEQRNNKAVAMPMEGVSGDHCRQRVGVNCAEKLEASDLRRRKNALGERLRNDVGRPDPGPIVDRRFRHAVTAVGDAAGEGDGPISRDRPRRCRPNND
jgi:hypothetical protein